MTFSTNFILLLKVKYSTPRKVEETTEINDAIACFNELLLISSIPSTKSNLSVASILKTSFLISSYTKFFLNSGAICKAFTLDSKALQLTHQYFFPGNFESIYFYVHA